ncbi:MAG TPA: DMT family transporter [Xanthobacteraceae bacterium]|nr:DMT family transporter [Xanthobacteraceae bacterium]
MKTESALLARDAAKARRARLIGIALMCGAVGTFSCLDTTAKYLGRHIDVMQVVWARYTFALLLTFIISNPLSRRGLLRTARPALQIVRAAILLTSTLLNFFALRYLRLDQVLAITFSTPFVVAALSGPTLGEWVGPRRWAAIGFGFIGVLVVTRPGFGIVHPAAILAVLATLAYAAYFLTTRVLSRTDSNETTLFYSNFVGAALMLPVAPFFWTWPALWQFGLMILAGALASFGHYMLIVAHRRAPASLLSSFIYSQLVWVVALGYAVFGDVPDAYTLAGASIVIASGLYVFHRERVRGPRTAVGAQQE